MDNGRKYWFEKSDTEELPDVAKMPCRHDLGKFIGDGKLQCCICSEVFSPPQIM